MRTIPTILTLALGIFARRGRHAREQTAQSGARRDGQVENRHVRVWKSIIMPKQPLSMHHHERPWALIALPGGTIDIVQKSGESEVAVWESAKDYWLAKDKPGTTHADVNCGSEPFEIIVVEQQKH